MSHLDPEVAALLALGEDAGPDAQRHVEECAECAAEVASFERAVLAGRATREGDTLLTPPDRVWESIRSELALADAGDEPTAATPEATPGGTDAADRHPAHHAARRRRVSRRPVFFVLAGSVAAVAALVAGVWAVGGIVPRTDIVAEARLDGFPAWQGASGDAVLERIDGHNRVVVDLDASVPSNGHREVWLLTADASDLVSLGVLEGSSGTFDVPDDVDVARFSVVDISQEADDGDAAHSGDSIVRGTLSAG